MIHRATCIAGLALVCGVHVMAAEIEVICLSGEPSPDGNGEFQWFLPPSLNDAGGVAFEARLRNTAQGVLDDNALFLATDKGIVQLVREGQAVPDLNGVFSVFGLGTVFGNPAPLLNENGQIAFLARLLQSSGGTADNSGLYLAGPAGVIQLVREGQAAPGSKSLIFGDMAEPFWPPFVLNDAGQVSFLTEFSAGGMEPITGAYRASPSGVDFLTLDGTAAPGGGVFASVGGLFGILGPLAIDQGGRTAVGGNIADMPFDVGILRLEPGVATVIGQNLPGSGLAMNEADEVAYFRDFSGKFGGSLSVGDGATLRVVRERMSSDPEGAGPIQFMVLYGLNDTGETLIVGTIDQEMDSVILDGPAPRVVIRKGDSMPDGNGILNEIFSTFGWVLNNAGQAAAMVNISETLGGASDVLGILFHDPTTGLQQVIRTGDTLLGRTVVDVWFQALSHVNMLSTLRSSGLNNSGDVAFSFALDDGTNGIAVWSQTVVRTPDFDGSGIVNALDLATLLALWGPGSNKADLNGDMKVNAFDLALLLAWWGPVN